MAGMGRNVFVFQNVSGYRTTSKAGFPWVGNIVLKDLNHPDALPAFCLYLYFWYGNFSCGHRWLCWPKTHVQISVSRFKPRAKWVGWSRRRVFLCSYRQFLWVTCSINAITGTVISGSRFNASGAKILEDWYVLLLSCFRQIPWREIA